MVDELPKTGRNEDWRPWLRSLGQQVRRHRELLGFSQDHLGRLAGISQGAVSRLETGHGLATPAVVVARVFLALIRGIKDTEPMVLSDDAKQLLEMGRWILPHAGQEDGHPSRLDDGFGQVVRSYQRLPPSKREAFVAIANTVLGSLASGQTPQIGSDGHGGGPTTPGRRG